MRGIIIKNKKNFINFLVMLLITFIIFIPWVKGHYATDTYNIIDRGYKEYAIKYSLNDGRPVMCLISLFAEYANIPINVYIISLTMLAIITSCISILLLINIIERKKAPKNIFEKIVIIIICYVTIFNFMFLENIQFAECFVMSVSILLYIIAANILTSESRMCIIKSLLLTILGILFYQGTLGFFVVTTLVFSLIKNKNKLFKNIIISGIMCIIAVLVNLVQIRLSSTITQMTQTRMGSIANIIQMTYIIIYNLKSILVRTANIFPKFAFISILIVTYVCIILYKPTRKLIYEIIILTIFTIGATFAINLFTLAGFGTARMMFPLGALLGNIFILIYTETEAFQTKMKYIMSTILIVYFAITVTNYINIIYCHKEVEKLTIKECEQINSYMNKYEDSTGIKLKYIAVCTDENPTYYYKEIKNNSALCIRPLSVEWGDNGSINYYTKRKLIEIPMPVNVYQKYFKGKDYTNLEEEQFIFIEDTVYYCIY